MIEDNMYWSWVDDDDDDDDNNQLVESHPSDNPLATYIATMPSDFDWLYSALFCTDPVGAFMNHCAPTDLVP
ncbi:Class A rhodopsin-like G-protein coupled receptor GPRdop1 [Echinococcus multilocularis]|uniref:Class A rhodopsin-like G-protein coupled receptor GPRdop1 n=1 Tax=Echinococcus multilocularis TaxID=6211 RepID=A0A0S4MM82_ECHMU|nr:Class A rhodopsin-like G-protein coupled receptor GPRdop1 [Echinococcus multilocularis]